MHAIILAGGLGTRLRSAVPDVPKPMAPIAGQPFLSYLLRYLELSGLDSVTLAIGYRGEVIQRFFGSRYGSLAVDYSTEKEPIGTGGAVRKALAKLEDECVFVLNGDTFVENDYQAMRDFHLSGGAGHSALTMLATEVSDAHRYGALEVQGDHIVGFREKGAGGRGLINAGVYLIDPGVLCDQELPARFSLERDWLVPGVEKIRPRAFRSGPFFIDIGIPEDYARAQATLPDRVV